MTDRRKTKLGGMKLSEGQTVIRITGEPDAQLRLPLLSTLLADNKINITFLTASPDVSVVCIASEDSPRAKHIVESEPRLASVDIRDHAAMLSIYPTGSSLELVGRVLETLSSEKLCPLSMATSLSSLVIIVDARDVRAAIDTLMAEFELPKNHAPVEPSFRFIRY